MQDKIPESIERNIDRALSYVNARQLLYSFTGVFDALLQRNTGCENARLTVEQPENQRAV
jgi:hypothetical protein